MTLQPRAAFDQPLTARAVEGEIVILGPAHLHGAFTPEAARLSAEALAEAAATAVETGAAKIEEPPSGS